MNITLKCPNLDLTPALKQYVEEKVSALVRHNGELAIARVELERLKRHHSGLVFRAEITVDAPGVNFRAESLSSDMYAAIDLMVPKLVVQLEKSKDKRTAKARITRRKLKGDEI